MLVCTSAFLSEAQSATAIDMDPEQMEREVILYQVELVEHTTDELERIYAQFTDTFMDYEPALERINILINNYHKVMNRLPVPVPEEGKKIDELMKKLLSKMENYYLHCKQTGRQNPYINFQIHHAIAEISQERSRLIFLYK